MLFEVRHLPFSPALATMCAVCALLSATPSGRAQDAQAAGTGQAATEATSPQPGAADQGTAAAPVQPSGQAADQAQLEQQITALKGDVSQRDQTIQGLHDRLQQAQQQVADLQGRLAGAQQEADAGKAGADRLARQLADVSAAGDQAEQRAEA